MNFKMRPRECPVGYYYGYYRYHRGDVHVRIRARARQDRYSCARGQGGHGDVGEEAGDGA